ncbi:Asp-tRNA(Asn)/Glu-tRNA(Gln) amidotransferase subunit GatC [Candidatus Saccharibacteria bacterium]|nr:Asp-tRNA(Asn)/Glu-tRNA(Gln) amidotransferase subunit GatC [Candidatus Saccharibacteria bacterium]
MTKITREDVLHLAKLSSLELTDDEVTAMQDELTEITDYIAMLGGLTTEGVEPKYQVSGLENIYREDEPQTSSVSREDLLALSYATSDDQVKVPKVL